MLFLLLGLVFIGFFIGKDELTLTVSYGVLDLLLMLFSETVFFILLFTIVQIEEVELCLSRDQCEQRVNAAFSASFEPLLFVGDGEAPELVEIVIGEHLHEFVAICCTGACILNVQSLKATAGGGSLSNEFEQLASVFISGFPQVGKFEVLKLVGLVDELPQRPLLKLIIVPEALDGQLLKAQLLVDCTSKLVKKRVQHLGRRASEDTANVKIGYGLEIDIIVPIANGVGGVLMKAIAHLFPVQLDGALSDVLGALGVDLGLDGHVEEVDAVDLEKKDLSW